MKTGNVLYQVCWCSQLHENKIKTAAQRWQREEFHTQRVFLVPKTMQTESLWVKLPCSAQREGVLVSHRSCTDLLPKLQEWDRRYYKLIKHSAKHRKYLASSFTPDPLTDFMPLLYRLGLIFSTPVKTDTQGKNPVAATKLLRRGEERKQDCKIL